MTSLMPRTDSRNSFKDFDCMDGLGVLLVALSKDRTTKSCKLVEAVPLVIQMAVGHVSTGVLANWACSSSSREAEQWR